MSGFSWARCVALFALFWGAWGCVVPPRLEVEDSDAQQNAPPIILQVTDGSDPLGTPGPLQILRDDPRRMVLQVSDLDVDDVLYVNVYVDYALPNALPPFSSCVASSTGRPERTTDCPMATLCANIDSGDTSMHFMEAVVSDRPIVEGEPVFRRIENPGLRSSWSWFFGCGDEAL